MADTEQVETKRLGLREKLALVHRPAILPAQPLEITRPVYDPEEFVGKAFLITGVSHFNGFGYETARQVIELGAGVVAINYRTHTTEVDEVVADLKKRALRTKIIAVQADISQLAEAASLVSRVVEQSDRLDVYVDNAGVIAEGGLGDQTPEEAYQDLMTNVVGPQIILGEVIKQMKTQGKGRVISLLSLGVDGVPNQSRYAGAKAFKYSAARSGAMEALLSRKDIMFVSVAPGFSPTTLAKGVEEKAKSTLMSLLGQEAELSPAEVAEYIVFAASSLVPNDLNGQVIPVYHPMRNKVLDEL